MEAQIVAGLLGFAIWLAVFIYGAVNSYLNPEPYRPAPRPRPRYPKGR